MFTVNLLTVCPGCDVCLDYDVCPARIVGLVHYPAILAPLNGSESVSVYCADNAHQTSSSLTVTCNNDGTWSGLTPVCECNTGYVSSTVNGVEICQSKYNISHIGH